jgi:signal transduction histidine kinase
LGVKDNLLVSRSVMPGWICGEEIKTIAVKKKWQFRSTINEFYRSVIIGDTMALKFGDRMIVLTCLIMTFFGLMSFVTNYLLGFGMPMLVSMLVLSTVFFCFYLIGRFKRITQLYYLMVMLAYLVAINFTWYFNYGSRGPVLGMFVILYALFIFVWDKKMVIISSVVLLLNILALFVLEWQNPEITGNYPTEFFRISDVYFGLFLSLILMLAFMATVRANYTKEYMHARKADQLKSAFLANMSHEIRTPLNAIVGFSSLIADDDFDQGQKEGFKNMINENSEYLLFLIEDIIDLSKIEVNELKFTNSKVKLADLFERLKVSFEKSLKVDRQNLEIRYRLNLPQPYLETDAFRLEQILRNLISNAIKFTEEGYVEFGAGLVDGETTFYVKDTGIGIRPENQEKVFGRFVKVEEGVKNLYRGTGIGLFLSKQLVQKLGGRIWIHSDLGEGATFYFTIDTNKSDTSIFSVRRN